MQKTLTQKTIRTTVSISLGIIGIVGLGVFSWMKLAPWIQGPRLELTGITTGETRDSSPIEISGTAIHSKSVTMNGTPVMVDEMGNFRHHIVLQSGYNTIDIRATDKFGTTHHERYATVVHEHSVPTLARITKKSENY